MKSKNMETRKLLALLCANFFIFVGYSQVNKNKLIDNSLKGIIKSVEYQYFLPDEKGELDEWGVVDFEECSSIITIEPAISCSFDKAGNIIASQVFSKNYEMMLYLQYTYDKNNRVTEVVYTDKSYPPHPVVETFTYDKNGNVINEHRELENNNISRNSKKEYDKDNNILKETVLNINKYKKVKDKEEAVYTYDKNKLCLRKDIFINGKKESYITYQYDDKKNLTLQQVFYKNKLKNEYSFTYYSQQEMKSSKYDETYNYWTEGKKGNLKGVKQEIQKKYNEKGILREHYIKKIDINGYLLEKASIGDNNEAEEKYVYTYDSKYNLIKKEFYKGTVVDRWETYSYNEKGLKTQEINYLKDGKIDFYEDKTYKYDEKGNPIEEKAVDKEGEVLYLYRINYTYYK